MNKTILLADDEPSLRLLVKATLAAKKYTVIEAANGHDALNLAKQVNPDAILLDVMMPLSDIEYSNFIKIGNTVVLISKQSNHIYP